MQKPILSILDEKTGIYSNPYVSQNIDTAKRDFHYACTQETQSELYRYTKDFHLFKIGTFDDNTGQINLEGRELIMAGTQLLAEKT